MKKYFTICILTFSIVPINASAVLCYPKGGNINSPGEYLLALSEALDYVKAGRDGPLKAADYKGSDWGTQFIRSIKFSEKDFECAISHISPFQKSKNEAISGSALGVKTSVLGFILRINGYLLKVKNEMDGKEDKRGAGTKADQAAIEEQESKADWETLVTSATLATYSGIIEKRNGYLDITSAERKEAKKKLENTFGKKLNKNDLRPLELSAHTLLIFLNGSWKSSDSK